MHDNNGKQVGIRVVPYKMEDQSDGLLGTSKDLKTQAWIHTLEQKLPKQNVVIENNVPNSAMFMKKMQQISQWSCFTIQGQALLTGTIVFLLLYFINPPFVQKPSKNNFRCPERSWSKLILLSIFCAIVVLCVPLFTLCYNWCSNQNLLLE